MQDNGSTSSLSSLQDERPERKRHQVWRKPVPEYVPDPPKKPSLLANSSALRRMALLTSGDERPPLPPNWRQNIDKALGMETLDVQRPASPTPDSTSNLQKTASRGVTTPKLGTSRSREEKALPKVPSLEANRQSDSDSTLAESTKSMKLETFERSSMRSVRSSRTRSLPPIKDRPSTPPPPAFHNARRGEDAESDSPHKPSDAAFRIVYPRGLGTNNLDTARRHVAVFPVFPGSSTDLSLNATVVNSLEDVRPTRNLHNSASIPSLLKPGASSFHGPDPKCESFPGSFGRRPKGLYRRVRHAFRGCLCLDATTHKY